MNPVKVSEADLQATVIDLARLTVWRVFHPRPARTQQGWRTAFTGDAGWPDLAMARGERLIIAELKAQRGRVTADQQEWLETLSEVTEIEACLWRPDDWNAIERTLTRKETA